MNGQRCVAVNLLIDDRAEQSLKGGLLLWQADSEGAGFGDEFGQFGVGGGESGHGFDGVVGELAGWTGARTGHSGMIAVFLIKKCFVIT